MTILITPNGFPFECTEEEYEVVAKKVEVAISKIEPSDEITFTTQLELLTVFVESIKSIKGIFSGLVSDPNLPVSPTVVTFLCALAEDVNKGDVKSSYKKAARSITLWHNLFSLEMPETSLVPASEKSIAVIRQASILQAHDVVSALSKSRPISELVDIMKILFGDHGHV